MSYDGGKVMSRIQAVRAALVALAAMTLVASCAGGNAPRFGSPIAADQLREDAFMADPWLAPTAGLIARGDDTSGTVDTQTVRGEWSRDGEPIPAQERLMAEAHAAIRADWWPIWVDCSNEIRLAKELPDGSFATALVWIKDGESVQLEVRIPSAAITQEEPPPAIADLGASCPSAGEDVELVPEAYTAVAGQIMGG